MNLPAGTTQALSAAVAGASRAAGVGAAILIFRHRISLMRDINPDAVLKRRGVDWPRWSHSRSGPTQPQI